MSIDSIVKLIGNPNIAGDLKEDKLQRIADDVINRARQDLDSMKEWKESVDHGIKLCQPEFKAKDKPWPGAANFKSTILTEAGNNFGNRATIELMRDPALVKAKIIGLTTIKNVIDKKASEVSRWKSELDGIIEGMQQLDPQDPQVIEMNKVVQDIQQKITANTQVIKEKKESIRRRNESADRTTEFMNWQINVKMSEWRSDQKRMMYALPNVGCLFKKTFYDATLGRCVSKLIKYPNFIVNQCTENMVTCRSFTDIIPYTKAEADIRIKQGLWIDANLYEDEADLDAGSDEANEAETTEDNQDKFYEQYCWLDLDNDGTEEPYIVTVHVNSAKVVRIVCRYDEDSIIVKSDDLKPMPLLDAQKKRAAMIQADNEKYLLNEPMPDPDDLSAYKIVRVEPVDIITKYGLIPAPDGSFLDVGFYHIIGSMTFGVNKTTNDLLNSGTLANQQGGIVAKNFRGKQKGAFSVRPGEFLQTEISPEALQGSIMPLPFKEPSATLFSLNEKMSNEARNFSTTADLGGNIQSNTAPTTALAMIQESLIPNTAHMSMIVDSMSSEFSKIHKLNRMYSDADDYKEIVGDDEAVFEEDFNTDGLAVVCSANPEMSSRMQRITLADAEMAQVPIIMQAGGNAVPIVKNYLRRIGSDNVDEIFPNEAEMSPEEKAQMKAMQEGQALQNDMLKKQNEMIALQTTLLQRGEDRKDFEAKDRHEKTLAEVEKLIREFRKVDSETILNLEKAETEQVQNKIDTYTAAGEAISAARAEMAEDEA